MDPIKNLFDLMVEQLRDLYYGEAYSLYELPEMIDQASNPELHDLLVSYINDHEDQVMRLKQVFEKQFLQKRGERCQGLNSLMDECRHLLERCVDTDVKNAALITGLQHAIHYKIAGYGAACTYAKTLGLWDEATIIHQNLEIEKDYDRKLAIIAESSINQKAVH